MTTLTEKERHLYNSLLYGGYLVIARKNATILRIEDAEIEVLEGLHAKIDQMIHSSFEAVGKYNKERNENSRTIAVVDEFHIMELQRIQLVIHNEIQSRKQEEVVL